MARYQNLSGGLLRVCKRTKDGYEWVLVEPGAIVSLSQDEVLKIKEELQYDDWFKNGFLVKLDDRVEGVTLESLQNLAKANMAEFQKGLKLIKSVEALKELLNLVQAKKKRELVEKRIQSLPHAEDGGGAI